MKYTLLIFFILPFVACAPDFYAPNRINIPELKQKGDIRLSGATGYLQFEGQAAYALTNNIGLMCNYANYGTSVDEQGFQDAGGGGIEMGAGYFTSHKNFIFENYANVGFGNFYNKYKFISPYLPDDDGKLFCDFTKLSFQSSITFQHKFFSASAACRFTSLTYDKIEGNYFYGYDNLGNYLRSNPIHNFIEPAVQMGVGYKNFRFNLHYQYSHHLNDDYLFKYTVFNYSAGIQLSFPAIGSKQKVKN